MLSSTLPLRRRPHSAYHHVPWKAVRMLASGACDTTPAWVGGEPVEEPPVAAAEAGEVLAFLLVDKGIQAPGGQPGLRQGVSESYDR